MGKLNDKRSEYEHYSKSLGIEVDVAQKLVDANITMEGAKKLLATDPRGIADLCSKIMREEDELQGKLDTRHNPDRKRIAEEIYVLVNAQLAQLEADEQNKKNAIYEEIKQSSDWGEDSVPVIDAHGHSSFHQLELSKDSLCGCFYCLEIFSPQEIVEWVDSDTNGTAICPHCEIDSIIGESSGYPITVDFLQQMHDFWFNSPG